MAEPNGVEQRPRSLIVSFFGLYAREVGGWVAVSDLVRLLGRLDVDEASVRMAISRLKRGGWLLARRVGAVAGYTLSPSAWEMLAEGDRRIYRRRVADPADGWVLAVFSVPEAQRHKRHLLRSRLARLGFGNAASGVWIAPAHLREEAESALRRLGLDEYVSLFEARYLAFGELRAMVASWWDLAGLDRMYGGYVRAYEPVLASWARRRRVDPAAAFVDHLQAADAWRRMPYLDPGLPVELVPEDWSGTRAAEVFFRLHATLAEPAVTHVRDSTREWLGPS